MRIKEFILVYWIKQVFLSLIRTSLVNLGWIFDSINYLALKSIQVLLNRFVAKPLLVLVNILLMFLFELPPKGLLDMTDIAVALTAALDLPLVPHGTSIPHGLWYLFLSLSLHLLQVVLLVVPYLAQRWIVKARSYLTLTGTCNWWLWAVSFQFGCNWVSILFGAITNVSVLYGWEHLLGESTLNSLFNVLFEKHILPLLDPLISWLKHQLLLTFNSCRILRGIYWYLSSGLGVSLWPPYRIPLLLNQNHFRRQVMFNRCTTVMSQTFHNFVLDIVEILNILWLFSILSNNNQSKPNKFAQSFKRYT